MYNLQNPTFYKRNIFFGQVYNSRKEFDGLKNSLCHKRRPLHTPTNSLRCFPPVEFLCKLMTSVVKKLFDSHRVLASFSMSDTVSTMEVIPRF